MSDKTNCVSVCVLFSGGSSKKKKKKYCVCCDDKITTIMIDPHFFFLVVENVAESLIDEKKNIQWSDLVRIVFYLFSFILCCTSFSLKQSKMARFLFDDWLSLCFCCCCLCLCCFLFVFFPFHHQQSFNIWTISCCDDDDHHHYINRWSIGDHHQSSLWAFGERKKRNDFFLYFFLLA